MQDLKSKLDEIFNIIDYKRERSELYNKLLGLCYLNALDNLIDTLPEGKKINIQSEIKGLSDSKQIQQIIIKYFNQDQFNDELRKSSEALFKEYIDKIKSSLSDQQINKLRDYTKSLNESIDIGA